MCVPEFSSVMTFDSVLLILLHLNCRNGGFGRKIGISDFSHRILFFKFLFFVNVYDISFFVKPTVILLL